MTNALNRKALYDLVWAKPISTVAKDYGLSDRGMAKLCERNSIPVPPRGYITSAGSQREWGDLSHTTVCCFENVFTQVYVITQQMENRR